MNLLLMGADLIAITVLMTTLYLPRQGRRELVSSFLVTNVGVLAVAAAMSTGTVSAGLGLGLFGVLSIIRLRSEELSHREIAYYFASLSLGLLGGLGTIAVQWGAGLMALILLAIAIGDASRLTKRTASSELLIDQAISDPVALTERVTHLVNGEILEINPQRIDLVDDSTLVFVRYIPTQRVVPRIPEESAVMCRRAAQPEIARR
ncbi:hypothetical protein HMPREF1531_01850 [Propionibacterium sp. oral taxon 192 str. F0372]|uniref:DUF4956 domain-containing protein n=1 Tax=Propionibacterium sp. oral taxon 192 TaxID=671222 RepID=UPI000354700D|nr:DUF4956 domain-containing protein [Propionibacterium sp. oral taxon 192]EPH02542.1 hypothetical protein HMPREF1531_01850 [Propionibacterium sp. oral taxon 192 str. F0372]